MRPTPSARRRTLRDLLELFATAVGRPLKIQVMPKFLVTALGLFDVNVREVKEMLYQWERPFVVDSSKFADRFWSDATPFDDGIAATAASFRS